MLTVRGLDRRPLALPAFRRLWLASTVTAIGGSFSVVAVPVQLFALTGSSAAIGWSAAVSFPALVVGALGSGVLADLRDRRSVLLAAHGLLVLTYALMWAQAATGLDSVPVLLVLVGAQSASYGAIMTTTGAVLPRLVPDDLLAAANGLASLTRYAGAAIGPLLAGVLIPPAGLSTLYLLDATALLAVLWAVARLPALPATRSAARPTTRPGTRRGPATGEPVLSEMRALTADRVLPAVLALDLTAMVFGLPTALFPELATDLTTDLSADLTTDLSAGPILDTSSAATLGLLHAAYPAGVCALVLLSGTFTRARRPGALMSTAATIWGLTVILAGLTASLTITVAALVLGGAANLVLSTCRNTITQAYPPDRLRGRVQGVLTVILFGGPQAATLTHGLAGSVLGARPAIVLGGLLTVAGVALITLAAPQLRRYPATGPAPLSDHPAGRRPAARPGPTPR